MSNFFGYLYINESGACPLACAGHKAKRAAIIKKRKTTRRGDGNRIERILEINARKEVTKTVVEAARESLVIGQG